MADAISFADSLDMFDAISFAELVDNSIRSSSASESDVGASPVHSFAELVDSLIRSPSGSDFEASPVHSFQASIHVAGAAQFFSQTELQAATNNFSLQNIVIQVQMDCQRCRNKALKNAAVTTGVTSVSLNGADGNKLVVTGYGIDIARLVKAIRKINMHATILSLSETETYS